MLKQLTFDGKKVVFLGGWYCERTSEHVKEKEILEGRVTENSASNWRQ